MGYVLIAAACAGVVMAVLLMRGPDLITIALIVLGFFGTAPWAPGSSTPDSRR